ncbi:MAG: hypothetical protein IKF99_11120 [Oscillospiraceae bacterium]|nr:hypothetical protein [Oscillospiraceae bacterium]
MMRTDLVRRDEVMKALVTEYNRRYAAGEKDGLRLAWIEKAVNSVPADPSVEKIICKIEKDLLNDPMEDDLK